MLKAGKNIIEFCYDAEEEKEYLNNWKLLQEYKVKKPTEKTYRANVKYLTWSGTRKHPIAKEHIYKNIEVVEKGCFYTFKTTEGDVKKKIGSNGTEVTKI